MEDDTMTDFETLRDAYKNKTLTIYLGAGVSMGSGLPSWDALVLAMYFKVMDQQRLGRWRPYPNYLLAISEWQLNHLHEPLEISARKIRRHFQGKEEKFRDSMWETLYEGFQPPEGTEFRPPDCSYLRNGNPTLQSIVELCTSRPEGKVKSVVTYNYDSLLESALNDIPHKPIWTADGRPSVSQIPVYHVHGYVPFDKKEGSAPEDIVFTEDQYNRVASDPYSWANLVQIHCMSSSVGLMIGLSLSDRNMRRLFDAVRSTPIATQHFALLQRPQWNVPDDTELDRIHKNAKDYLEKFERSGVKRSPGEKGPNWRHEIAGILQEVQSRGTEQEEQVLFELGIEPIWYDKHSEIPGKLRKIYE